MKIQVNNYSKGSFRNQLERAFEPLTSDNNKHTYNLKDDWEYRGRKSGYDCFSRKIARKEINEIQILCTVIKEA